MISRVQEETSQMFEIFLEDPRSIKNRKLFDEFTTVKNKFGKFGIGENKKIESLLWNTLTGFFTIFTMAKLSHCRPRTTMPNWFERWPYLLRWSPVSRQTQSRWVHDESQYFILALVYGRNVHRKGREGQSQSVPIISNQEKVYVSVYHIITSLKTNRIIARYYFSTSIHLYA